MKYRFFIAFGLFWGCFSPASAAYVGGTMQGSFSGDRLEVLIPHYYLDGKSSKYAATLDDRLQFGIAVEVPEPLLAFVVHNGIPLAVFLGPNDTLLLRANAFEFPFSVTFGGTAAANNIVLKQYLEQFPNDFNDFNNLRFKVGLYWTSVEEADNVRMLDQTPEVYRATLNAQKTAAFALHDDLHNQLGARLSPEFSEWLATDIIYRWAYGLLAYAQVYGNRYAVPPEFLDFLYEAPTDATALSNGWYQQFVMLLIAHRQLRMDNTPQQFWPGMYALAGSTLEGGALGYVRSEILRNSFSEEHFQEILPLFRDFMQNNPTPAYGEKVADIYQKLARRSPGTAAPDFAARNAAGQEVALAQWRGRVVYLNFWASWCAACIRKMDVFNGFESALHQQGIEVVNVSLDEDPEAWHAALTRGNYMGTHLRSSLGAGQSIARMYGVEAIPQYFIIDRAGLFSEKPFSAQPEDILAKLLEINAKKP